MALNDYLPVVNVMDSVAPMYPKDKKIQENEIDLIVANQRHHINNSGPQNFM